MKEFQSGDLVNLVDFGLGKALNASLDNYMQKYGCGPFVVTGVEGDILVVCFEHKQEEFRLPVVFVQKRLAMETLSAHGEHKCG